MNQIAGSCTVRTVDRPDGGVDVWFAWTATAAGAVTYYIDTAELPEGYVHSLTTNPTDTPSDNYDITIEDCNGSDILRGLGTDRDTTTTEVAYSSDWNATSKSYKPVVESCRGPFTFSVANAGNAKSGVAIVAIVKPQGSVSYVYNL